MTPDGELNPIDTAKVQLMVGLSTAIKAKYRTPCNAATKLHMDAKAIYRVVNFEYQFVSLAWLIQLLDKLGATVHITVEMGKPEPIKEPLVPVGRFRRSVRVD